MKSPDAENFSIESTRTSSFFKTNRILPGVLLSFAIGGFTYYLHGIPTFSMVSMITIAIALGLVIGNTIKLPNLFKPGIKFSGKRILKLAIIILGFKLNFNDAIRIGNIGFGVTFITIISTFIFTYWLGKKLGLNDKLIQLIAAGTSICGTSAVVAINAVIHASDEDTAYSVTMITTYSIIAMLIYPVIGAILHLSPAEFGFWSGFSIQQTSHVIATSFQYGSVSGDLATISKLSRVIYLVPAVILLGLLSSCNYGKNRQNLLANITIPWFIVLFLGMSLINTYVPLGTNVKEALINLDTFLFVVAMAAIGLDTKFKAIATTGLKPFYLAGLSWLFIAFNSLFLIKIFMISHQ